MKTTTKAVILATVLASSAVLQAQQRSARPKTPAPAPPPPRVDSGCEPSTAWLKQQASVLRQQHLTDDTAFFSALDAAVGGAPTMGPLHDGTIVVHYSDALMIYVLPRYTAFRSGLKEAIRKMDPLEDVPAPDGVEVAVLPNQMDAADIVKVVVTRGGVAVAPVLNALTLREFHNRMGGTAMLHEGFVLFPCSAFAPNALVVVTAIPDAGSNLSGALSLGDLRGFK